MSEIIYSCPLCRSSRTSLFHRDRYRTYFMCPDCGLVHVPGQYHLSHEGKKHRYDLHTNNAEDEGYRRFLAKLINPLLERLDNGAEGLDYGSGPEPVLAAMLSEKGFKMEIFDPFYADDRRTLERKYDFLTCCETMEHFVDPRKEWEQFIKLVKKGGWIGIMTQLLESADDFARWHYINDETHVCFFSGKTFEWLGKQYGVKIVLEGTSVVLGQV
ncbi:MAG: class I SAM-dependent methyltransferase [Kiritimatiellae bacterium]|nr:class I SAM-dependent methyltransferase [Kiritimatiellia bacterium]MDD5521124.1 class I SAM-dependent methyltransferase [Kiritimatiellia bacterium]